MERIETVRDLINLWPKRETLADEMRAHTPELDVTKSRVDKWAENGSIPAKYQYSVFLAAKARGFEISAEQIIRLNSFKTKSSILAVPSCAGAGLAHG